MIGSLDSLDFSIYHQEYMNKSIPLHCWQNIPLRKICLPVHLLSSRNKSCNIKSTDVIYHTLQKKNASKYSESFSVYIDPSYKNEQEEIFLSDSDEDICNTSTKLGETKGLSNNLSDSLDDDSTHFSKSFNHKEKYFKNNNLVFKRNDGNVYSNLKASSVNNLCNFDEQKDANLLCLKKSTEKCYRGIVGEENNKFIQNVENINYCDSQSSSASNSVFLEQMKHFNCMQTVKKAKKDSDSHISLNEIIKDAPVASLKDFESNFVIRKREKDVGSYTSFDEQKNTKKSKRDKKEKKMEKYLPVECLFEDMEETQEFNCNRYMNNILRERERLARIGDNPLVSKEEYPDLISEEPSFIHSDNIREEENVNTRKYAEIVKNSTYSKRYMDSTTEELKFCHSDSIAEDVEFIPKFSFIHSDKPTERIILIDEDTFNDATIENAEVEETTYSLQVAKIVIENIPFDVSKDDISVLLEGYGKIENFYMISTGKCLKAFVDIYLNCDCDIDWVIECLNGSEPFGTSTGVLKCYQQTE